MPKGIEIVVSLASLLVTLFVLAVQLGFWGGGISARKTPDDTNGSGMLAPGRLRDVIAALEASVEKARILAHEARNIANVTKGETVERAKQVERDLDRLDRAIADNTRRIDELWRVVRSGEGV